MMSRSRGYGTSASRGSPRSSTSQSEGQVPGSGVRSLSAGVYDWKKSFQADGRREFEGVSATGSCILGGSSTLSAEAESLL